MKPLFLGHLIRVQCLGFRVLRGFGLKSRHGGGYGDFAFGDPIDSSHSQVPRVWRLGFVSPCGWDEKFGVPYRVSVEFGVPLDPHHVVGRSLPCEGLQFRIWGLGFRTPSPVKFSDRRFAV